MARKWRIAQLGRFLPVIDGTGSILNSLQGEINLAESIWKSEDIIGEVEKGKDLIRIKRVVNKSGKEYVDIRLFFVNDADEWQPTRKGMAIPVEIFPQVLEVLERLK